MNKFTQNILSLLSGQVIILLLNLISITLAARFISVENFGRFSALLAIITIVSKAFDLGFPAIVFRELSLQKKNINILNTAIVLTIFLFLITGVVFNIVLFILDMTAKEIILLNVMLVNSLLSIKFTNMRELLQTPFKVDLKMHIPMSVAVIDNLLFLFLVLLIPIVNGGLTFFILIYVLSNLPGFLTMLILLYNKYGFSIKFEIERYLWLFKEALPVYGYLVFDALLQQTDIIFLKKFHGDYEVGVYSIALRYVVPLIFIPSAIIQSLLPSITRNRDQKPEKNNTIFNLTLKIFFFISVIITLVIFFKSKDIVLFILGSKYIESATPLGILLLSQVFIYFNFFCFNMFIAYGKQRINFGITIFLFTINFVLNLLIIPAYSFNGAAMVRFITSLAGVIFIFLFLRKINLNVWFFELKTLLWLIILSFSLYLLSQTDLILYGLGSITVAISLTIIFKYFSFEDVYMFLTLINKEELVQSVKRFRNKFLPNNKS